MQLKEHKEKISEKMVFYIICFIFLLLYYYYRIFKVATSISEDKSKTVKDEKRVGYLHNVYDFIYIINMSIIYIILLFIVGLLPEN